MSTHAEPNVYDDAKSAEVTKQHRDDRRNFGAITVALAAEESGATIRWLTPRSFWAILDDRRIPISSYYGAESALAWSIERDKILAKDFWASQGVSVPPGRQADSPRDAVQAQTEIGAPVVLKPITALGGTGVTVNVSEPTDIRDGFTRAQKAGTGVLVEKYVEGTEYRAHATPDECVGVFRRVLPNVTGDGRTTIKELIQQKNRMRQLSPATKGRPIPIDDVTVGFLRRRGLTLDSVVAQEHTITVRDVNSLTSGGDTQECLATVSDTLKETAIAATASIPGMNWGGVDIIIEEGTGTPYVMEINTNAMTIGSIFPVFGTPRDLAQIVFQKVWEQSVPEPVGEPLLAASLTHSLPMGRDRSWPKERRLSLQNLLMRRMEQHGYQVVAHNRKVWSAATEERSSVWFGGTHSASDLRVATIPLNNLGLLQESLKAQGVPTNESRRIGDVTELENFRQDRTNPVAIIRSTTPRPATRPVVIENEDSIDDSVLRGSRAWTVQEWIHGHRFSVIASPERAFAVVGSSALEVPSEYVVDEACRLAVSAVRAMPQLNWAVVDVVCVSPDTSPVARPRALVERLSANPTFDTESLLLAGSIDDALDFILDRTRTSELGR